MWMNKISSFRWLVCGLQIYLWMNFVSIIPSAIMVKMHGVANTSVTHVTKSVHSPFSFRSKQINKIQVFRHSDIRPMWLCDNRTSYLYARGYPRKFHGRREDPKKIQCMHLSGCHTTRISSLSCFQISWDVMLRDHANAMLAQTYVL
jgi:hypothetical protein